MEVKIVKELSKRILEAPNFIVCNSCYVPRLTNEPKVNLLILRAEWGGRGVKRRRVQKKRFIKGVAQMNKGSKGFGTF